jgi:IgGFc binding protein
MVSSARLRPGNSLLAAALLGTAGAVLGACGEKANLKPAAGAAAPGTGGASGSAPAPSDAGAIALPDAATDLPAQTPTVELDCAGAAKLQGNAGCRFHAVPIAQGAVPGSCFAVFIANPGGQPASVQLFRNGERLSLARAGRTPTGSGRALGYRRLENDQIPAGEVGILFLAHSDDQMFARCPVEVMPAVVGRVGLELGADPDEPVAGTGSSFQIVTDRPVVAYQVFPYGGGSSAVTSATLLLPEESWGRSYLAVHPVQNNAIPVARVVGIVAAADDTTVTLRPTNAVGGEGGVPAIAGGALGTLKLKAGQYVELGHRTAELTGSVIAADKPIGVFGGAPCLQIPAEPCCCDSAHQQIPPVSAWGHEYAAVRYPPRVTGQEEAVPWRIVGAVDGTKLTYRPAAPAGAPATLARGQFVEFTTAEPFVVQSQDAEHPFYLAGYMTSGEPFGGAGDPEFVNVAPTAQFLSSYVFFTDPTYPETHLTVVRRRGADGAFSDVRLGCNVAAIGGWRPLGDLEFTRVAISTGNWQPAIPGCDNGRLEMSSAAPFGVTVWGWGTSATGAGTPGGQYPHTPLPAWYTRFASYAYPAGASVGRVNQVVVIP